MKLLEVLLCLAIILFSVLGCLCVYFYRFQFSVEILHTVIYFLKYINQSGFKVFALISVSSIALFLSSVVFYFFPLGFRSLAVVC